MLGPKQVPTLVLITRLTAWKLTQQPDLRGGAGGDSINLFLTDRTHAHTHTRTHAHTRWARKGAQTGGLLEQAKPGPAQEERGPTPLMKRKIADRRKPAK